MNCRISFCCCCFAVDEYGSTCRDDDNDDDDDGLSCGSEKADANEHVFWVPPQ